MLCIEVALFVIVMIAYIVQYLPWVSSYNIFGVIYGPLHFIILSTLGPMLSLLVTGIYNSRPSTKNKNVRRAWEKDDLAAMLGAAVDSQKSIAISLDNRKVYIGLVARTNEPDYQHSSITILPLFSGYREEKTMKMIITNRYVEVFEYLEEDGPSSFPVEDFYIVLPVIRVSSCHIFNDEIYERLNPQGSLSGIQ